MTTLDEIRRRAAAYHGDYVRDLERIVNIDSGTFDKAGVDQAGALLRDLLAGLGCEITVHPHADLGDNFTATLRGAGTRRLMLLGHFDTVYPAGTVAERPFTVRDGRGYGPATMDMKGGLILGYYALRLLRDLGFDDFAEITFVANADEEIGSPTSRGLIESEASRMDAVFVLEPGRAPGGVLATRKGVGMYELTVRGRAAHAGAAPQDGRNANLELAHKIIAMHELNDPAVGTTVSANVMRGGSRRNVIADHAVVEVDVRVPTRAEAERVHAAMVALAERRWVPDTETVLTGGLNRPPMEKVPGTAALLDVARGIVEGLGLEFQELTSGGGSDGNFTAALGVSTLDSLGPVGQHAHSVDEWVDLETVPERLALVAALLMQAPARP
ncbi:MAG: M20 family metallopeptidase [Sphaerobacter sp.]|nr:M20 family metallopeptidase [Sphaerobacter sp.]